MDTAFSRALVGESMPDELHAYNLPAELMVKFARTVAYKVFHNLKHGLTMDPAEDPLMVDGVPAREAWAQHYAEQIITRPDIVAQLQQWGGTVEEDANGTDVILTTAQYVYNIRCKDNYLGCCMKRRFPYPGETWQRGNDLSDGPATQQTWTRILADIVGVELQEAGKAENAPKCAAPSRCVSPGDVSPLEIVVVIPAGTDIKRNGIPVLRIR